MAPKAPEKSPQQPPPTHNNAVVAKHSNPFFISANTLCHNRRLKQKRSRYVESIRNALSRPEADTNIACKINNRTEPRRQKLSLLRPEVTIDLLSDDDGNAAEEHQQQWEIVHPGRMCLERAALLGLMPVERLTNGPPPLIPLGGNKQKRSTTQPHNPPQPRIQQQQQQQQPNQQQPRKRKARPHKRRSLPAPVLLNNESIVLSDDSDTEQTNGMVGQTPRISIRPDLAVIYPTTQSSPCHQPAPAPAPPPSQQTTMQVDEDVTISLVPRSLTATTCARSRSSLNTSINNTSNSNATSQQDPPFPMLPDETTVHTVIANRIYELSLTKLREGLASCGIPEFNGGQQKISPPRRKGAIKQPPIVTQPQGPISLKLSSDLSISLISDDEDDTRHHRKTETLLSPAFLQKLPVNVSIAPVSITQHAASVAVDPRKHKFG